MPGINSTFGTGYDYDDDFDYRLQPKSEFQQEREKRREEKADRRKAAKAARTAGPLKEGDERQEALPRDEASNVIQSSKRTFMLEFTTICGRCNRTSGRGTKVYAQVSKLREKYLNEINIWELKYRCPKCSVNYITLRTDPATRSYVVVSGGRQISDGRVELSELAGDKKDDEPPKDATDEMTARLEEHQRLAMESEAVDSVVNDQLLKLMGDQDDAGAALAATEAAAAVASAADDEDAVGDFTEEEANTVRAQFAALRSQRTAQASASSRQQHDQDVQPSVAEASSSAGAVETSAPNREAAALMESDNAEADPFAELFTDESAGAMKGGLLASVAKAAPPSAPSQGQPAARGARTLGRLFA